MCDLRPVIQPDEKLSKMLVFLKIILILNLLSVILRIFINPPDMFYDLFCCLFLFLAYNTCYFVYAAINIIFSLINAVYLFISSGTVIQMIIQDTLGKKNIAIFLGISLYLFIFYIFSIIMTYPAYKEMKAQLMESFGGAANNLRLNSSANRPSDADVERPAPQNRGGFVAFSGNGVAVGGGS